VSTANSTRNLIVSLSFAGLNELNRWIQWPTGSGLGRRVAWELATRRQHSAQRGRGEPEHGLNTTSVCPTQPALHFHSLPLALSLSSALPCSRRGTRQHRRAQHRVRRRLACATPHHRHLHLASRCASSTCTALTCWLLQLRLGEGVFPFSPLAGTSAAIATSTESSPQLGSSALFFRF